jgi:hypothetical protein
MAWNQTPAQPGYSKESWNLFPTAEEATATVTNVTSLAPSQSQTPTGEYLATQLEIAGPQQGSNVVSGTVPISSGWAASQQAANNYTAGSVGTPGNKFS